MAESLVELSQAFGSTAISTSCDAVSGAAAIVLKT